MLTLPFEIWLSICALSPAQDIIHLLGTCRALSAYIHNESIWRELSIRYGLKSPSDLGAQSFYTAYTCILHPYGGLIGLWAGDAPFTGNIVEFSINPVYKCLIGEEWRFPPVETGDLVPSQEMGYPRQPRRICFLKIKLGAPGHLANVMWTRTTAGWLDPDGRRSSLCIIPSSSVSIFIHTPGHPWELHPDFPADTACWYDTMRGLPRRTGSPNRPDDAPIVDMSQFDSHPSPSQTTHLIQAKAGALKPPSLYMPTAATLNNQDLFFPYKYKAGRHLFLLTTRREVYPTRYYPLRAEIQGGILPEDEAWHPDILTGLWLGSFSSYGTECLYLEHDADTHLLRAWKITGDANVPRGAISWEADLVEPVHDVVISPDMVIKPGGVRCFNGRTFISLDAGFLSYMHNRLDAIVSIIGKNKIDVDCGFILTYVRYTGRDTDLCYE